MQLMTWWEKYIPDQPHAALSEAFKVLEEFQLKGNRGRSSANKSIAENEVPLF